MPIRAKFVRNPFLPAGGTLPDINLGIAAANGPAGGFESSFEGWLPGSKGIEVVRDSIAPASGRYCLCLRGPPPLKNCCGQAGPVVRRDTGNVSRRTRIGFNMGLGKGADENPGRPPREVAVLYGPKFRNSGSARYVPLAIPAWKHMSLAFTEDTASEPDLYIELRAGKKAPFRVYLDNFTVR